LAAKLTYGLERANCPLLKAQHQVVEALAGEYVIGDGSPSMLVWR
jgi:hypothetical protein